MRCARSCSRQARCHHSQDGPDGGYAITTATAIARPMIQIANAADLIGRERSTSEGEAA